MINGIDLDTPYSKSKGIVLIFTTIALFSIFAITGLAIESGNLVLNKTRLQNAVDAAALSASKTFVLTGITADTVADSQETFTHNLSAEGYGELKTNQNKDAFLSDTHWDLEYLSSLNGKDTSIIPDPSDPSETRITRFIRVTIKDASIKTYLARIFGKDEFKITVSAVAGLSPSLTEESCNLTPILVCGVPDDATHGKGTFWGYEDGQVHVLKISSQTNGNGNNTEVDEDEDAGVGPGNFHLVDFDGKGGGSPQIEGWLKNGFDGCLSTADIPTIETETGNKVDAVSSGINSRIQPKGDGLHDLVSIDPKPKDITGKKDVENNSGYTPYDVTNLKTNPLPYTYSQYQTDTATCLAPSGSGPCADPTGTPERRVISVVVGNCTKETVGVGDIPVLGFGCFFLPQSVDHNGNTGEVYGEFVEGCIEPGGFPQDVPESVNANAPKRIILYKDPKRGDA